MRDRQSVTICRESVVNHEEPKEFEELSRQLHQRSRGKGGNALFDNERTFSFYLCSFWASLWTLESEVRE